MKTLELEKFEMNGNHESRFLHRCKVYMIKII